VSAFLSAYGLFLAEVLTLVAIVILIVLLIKRPAGLVARREISWVLLTKPFLRKAAPFHSEQPVNGPSARGEI